MISIRFVQSIALLFVVCLLVTLLFGPYIEIPTVTSNNDWTPYTATIDNIEMVLIPPGCFIMGNNDGERDEHPAHDVCFDAAFWIDRYEVTNSQYNQPIANSYCNYDQSSGDKPRICTSWVDAQAHCLARGGRLPTEAEWEYAARGPSSWIYPWGNELENSTLMTVDNSRPSDIRIAPVGSHPERVSWVGALDMAGNVWEWTQTIYDPHKYPYPYQDDGRNSTTDDISLRVLRGGSFFSAEFGTRTTMRNNSKSSFELSNGGFRCVITYE